MGEDLEKFTERYPTYIEALEMLEQKDQRIAELEQQLAEMTKKYELASCPTGGLVDRVRNLEQQLAENNEFFNAFACKDFNEFKDFISTFMLAPHEEQTLIRELKQQLAEKDKEIERLKKNHLISYTNQKKAYENLKNSMNTKSLIKYPKRLDGCLIKNEQQLLDYAKESTLDIKYLRNNQTQLAIQELEKVKNFVDGRTYCADYINKRIQDLKGE